MFLPFNFFANAQVENMINNMIQEEKTTPTKYKPLLLLHRLCFVSTNETKVEFRPTTFECGVIVFVVVVGVVIRLIQCNALRPDLNAKFMKIHMCYRC